MIAWASVWCHDASEVVLRSVETNDSLCRTDQVAGLDQLVTAINEGIRALAAIAVGEEFERGF